METTQGGSSTVRREVLDLSAFFRSIDQGQQPESVPDDVFTAEDVKQSIGCCLQYAQKRIRAAIEADLVEMVKVPRPTIDGRVMRVAAYRVKKGVE